MVYKLLSIKFIKKLFKFNQQYSKKHALTIIGVLLVISFICIGVTNPGNIVQKSLETLGFSSRSQFNSENISFQGNLTNPNKLEYPLSQDESNNKSAEQNELNNNTSIKNASEPEPSGSHAVITVEEWEAHKNKGEQLLIARKDWDVKINNKYPSSCGTSSNPCLIGTEAMVNLSAYNVRTNELLPITECNGKVNKPYFFSDSTQTTLIDSNHCEIKYTPSSSGMYRLEVELYLDKKIYTDTIYWGGYVWGTDNPKADGYFVQ